jgi:dTDP-4-amino-4,6-dideoxygalactose transaminase
VITGEGGALLVNDSRFIERAEIVREKDHRSRFFRGEVDKYTWVEHRFIVILPGRNRRPPFCCALARNARRIPNRASRFKLWNAVSPRLDLPTPSCAGRIRRPIIPADCRHKRRMYNKKKYVLAQNLAGSWAGLIEAPAWPRHHG